MLTGYNIRPQICQTCKIRCQFNENAVIFHGTHYACDRFTGGKTSRIFHPCAEQFLVRQEHSAVLKSLLTPHARRLTPEKP